MYQQAGCTVLEKPRLKISKYKIWSTYLYFMENIYQTIWKGSKTIYPWITWNLHLKHQFPQKNLQSVIKRIMFSVKLIIPTYRIFWTTECTFSLENVTSNSTLWTYGRYIQSYKTVDLPTLQLHVKFCQSLQKQGRWKAFLPSPTEKNDSWMYAKAWSKEQTILSYKCCKIPTAKRSWKDGQHTTRKKTEFSCLQIINIIEARWLVVTWCITDFDGIPSWSYSVMKTWTEVGQIWW